MFEYRALFCRLVDSHWMIWKLYLSEKKKTTHYSNLELSRTAADSCRILAFDNITAQHGQKIGRRPTSISSWWVCRSYDGDNQLVCLEKPITTTKEVIVGVTGQKTHYVTNYLLSNHIKRSALSWKGNMFIAAGETKSCTTREMRSAGVRICWCYLVYVCYVASVFTKI